MPDYIITVRPCSKLGLFDVYGGEKLLCAESDEPFLKALSILEVRSAGALDHARRADKALRRGKRDRYWHYHEAALAALKVELWEPW